MKMVYICSPYRADKEKNTERVKQYCRMADVYGCLLTSMAACRSHRICTSPHS